MDEYDDDDAGLALGGDDLEDGEFAVELQFFHYVHSTISLIICIVDVRTW